MKTFWIHKTLQEDLLASLAKLEHPKVNISLTQNDINDGKCLIVYKDNFQVGFTGLCCNNHMFLCWWVWIILRCRYCSDITKASNAIHTMHSSSPMWQTNQCCDSSNKLPSLHRFYTGYVLVVTLLKVSCHVTVAVQQNRKSCQKSYHRNIWWRKIIRPWHTAKTIAPLCWHGTMKCPCAKHMVQQPETGGKKRRLKTNEELKSPLIIWL